MVVAAFVLGILSVALNWILCWLPIVSQIICMILGIVAIILAVVGMKKFPEKKGLAVAGLILGIIGTVYGLISLIACGLAAAAVGRAAKGMGGELEGLLEEALEEAGEALQ